MSTVSTDTLFSAYTPDVVNKIAQGMQRKQPQPGFYAGIIKSNIFTTSKASGNPMFVTEIVVLRDPNDESSELFKFPINVYTAIANDKHEEKARTFLTRKLTQLVSAAEVEGVLERPSMVDGTLTFNGQALNPSDEQDANRQVFESVLAAAGRLAQDPSQAEGQAIFVKFEWETDKEGNVVLNDKGYKRPTITWMGSTLPKNAELMDPSEALA